MTDTCPTCNAWIAIHCTACDAKATERLHSSRTWHVAPAAWVVGKVVHLERIRVAVRRMMRGW